VTGHPAICCYRWNYQMQKSHPHVSNYGGKVRMPPIPSPNGFLNSGMNTRPVFFGCDNQDVPTMI
jgi:lysophospholipase